MYLLVLICLYELQTLFFLKTTIGGKFYERVVGEFFVAGALEL